MTISCDKMYTFLRGFATGAKLPLTLRALSFAREQHKGQLRKSGDPYVSHPLAMALDAIGLGFDDDTILATILLHDVLEDCNVSAEQLPVSDEVKEAVNLLTFKRIQGYTEDESLRLYYDAIASSRIAVVVKLLDRCHNLSTMTGAFSYEKQMRYIEETKVYVLPLFQTLKSDFPEIRNRLFPVKLQLVTIINILEGFLCPKEADHV